MNKIFTEEERYMQAGAIISSLFGWIGFDCDEADENTLVATVYSEDQSINDLYRLSKNAGSAIDLVESYTQDRIKFQIERCRGNLSNEQQIMLDENDIYGFLPKQVVQDVINLRQIVGMRGLETAEGLVEYEKERFLEKRTKRFEKKVGEMTSGMIDDCGYKYKPKQFVLESITQEGFEVEEDKNRLFLNHRAVLKLVKRHKIEIK